ncbi:MAG: arsenate reductase, partial [Flavobacteriaceae bacterium]
MIKIYHNPRCRKSRQGLAIVENSGKEFEVIEYLKETPTREELKNIIDLLEINHLELVRKNEQVWKDNYKG